MMSEPEQRITHQHDNCTIYMNIMKMKRSVFSTVRYSAMLLLLSLIQPSGILADVQWQPLPTGEVTRIAFGSCAKQWQHQPILQTVIDAAPDVFLYLGDAIYADTDGKAAWNVTEDTLRGEWNRLADKPEFQHFVSLVPVMATWDNHDYGTYRGGKEFPLKKASQRIFLDFFGEPNHSPRRQHSGVYDAKIFGPKGRRVQIILLDTKFNRSPLKDDEWRREKRRQLGKIGTYTPDNASAVTLLGQTQWAWLEEQLNKPAEVRLIASSIQIIPDEKGKDEWGAFPNERQRLFNLITKSHAGEVVFLSGNVHFAEISKIDLGTMPLYELTASGMTHTNATYGHAKNSYRVTGPYIDLNFGLVEIDWESEAGPQIALNAIGQDGTVALQQQITFSSLSSGNSPGSLKPIQCRDPRPQICTREYQPVCAEHSGGNFDTYATGCTACSNSDVIAYHEGSCE
jgi:alkaline phosphatase D